MRRFAQECPDRQIGQQPADQLPWFHLVCLLSKVSEPAEREWYARNAIEHGWSRNILNLQISGQAARREGKAIHNFPATLPPLDSDLAAQVFKDPYLFDFLGTANSRDEGHAFDEVGLFGNQNTVCRPKAPIWRHTVERLKTFFTNWEIRPSA